MGVPKKETPLPLPLGLQFDEPKEVPGKVLGAVQAYQRVYYPHGLKDIVDAEWAEHVAANPGIEKRRGEGVKYRNEVAKRFYEAEPDEVKAEIESKRWAH
jgi:hypothetical protein